MKTRNGKMGRSTAAPPAHAGPTAARPLRERIADMDAVLAVFAAGLSARRDQASPGRAAALAAVATTFAEAASALTAEAETATAGGRDKGGSTPLALAAAGLQLRVARLRLRLVEYGAHAGSNRRR